MAPTLRLRAAAWPAILLAGVAGFTDALGYLALHQVFTAHMSGNAAAMGAYAGQLNWREVLHRGSPIPAFVFGAAVGATAVTLTSRLRLRARLAPAFALETALLTVFAWACPPAVPAGGADAARVLGLVWLLATAMGIQAATLRRVGEEHVTTTFVSGMLISSVEAFVAWLLGGANSDADEGRRRQLAHAGLYAAIFATFMAAAVAGSACELHWGPHALVLPIAGLLVVIVGDMAVS